MFQCLHFSIKHQYNNHYSHALTYRKADLKQCIPHLLLHLFPLQPIDCHFQISSKEPDPQFAQQGSSHPIHPSLYSFIISRMLNGAQLLTSDLFQ